MKWVSAMRITIIKRKLYLLTNTLAIEWLICELVDHIYLNERKWKEANEIKTKLMNVRVLRARQCWQEWNVLFIFFTFIISFIFLHWIPVPMRLFLYSFRYFCRLVVYLIHFQNKKTHTQFSFMLSENILFEYIYTKWQSTA